MTAQNPTFTAVNASDGYVWNESAFKGGNDLLGTAAGSERSLDIDSSKPSFESDGLNPRFAGWKIRSFYLIFRPACLSYLAVYLVLRLRFLSHPLFRYLVSWLPVKFSGSSRCWNVAANNTGNRQCWGYLGSILKFRFRTWQLQLSMEPDPFVSPSSHHSLAGPPSLCHIRAICDKRIPVQHFACIYITI